MTELEQEIAHLQELQAKHRKNIRNLEKQIAIYAGTPPLELLNKLEHEQEQLRQVEAQLEALTTQAVPEKPPHPGGLPPIFNLPYHRNPNFTGRESLLTQLRSALTSGQPTALTQAIHGLGGVGKTQLALEYAYRHLAEYDVVWWVRAEETATLASDYAALAWPLDLPEKEARDQRLVVEAVCRWLARHSRWLLIFDNARRPEEVRPYLPQGVTGHVLVTSRNPNWQEVAKLLTVQVLKRAESVAFLLKRTRETDETAASELAKALGDLPLALAQAGAYVSETGTTFTAYLELFQSRRTELWEKERPPLDYPDTVATTWDISFQQVQKTSPAGVDLLNLCAFLAPDDVPRDLLLVGGAEHLPEALAGIATDPLAFDEAVVALHRYALLERTGDTLSVHRLVQAVTRDRLADDARRTWAEAAVQIVDDAFPSGDDPQDVRTWPVCARLLPHALAAAEHAEALQVASEATGRLLNQAGLYLGGRAEFAEAKVAFGRALAIDEAALGPDHPNVATDVSNLGSMLRALGDLEGAKAHFEQALAIDEAAFGPDHPKVAIRVNNLGGALRDLGDLEGAKAHYERALTIRKQKLGENHPGTATTLNDLGNLLRQQGNHAEARIYLEQALAVYEQVFGKQHPWVATAVNNLGTVLRALGDLEGAKAHYERALAILEKQLGPEHPQVASGINNLGMVLRALGDLEEAKAHCERALAISEAALGPGHPNVAIRVNNLGSVLRDLGDLEGARTHYERALRILRESLGEDHPLTVKVRNNLASLDA